MVVLETSRIRLRQFTLDDVFNLMGILADPIAMKYYPWYLTKPERESGFNAI